MVITTLSEWNAWWKTYSVEKDLLGKERLFLKEVKKSLSLKEIKLFIGIRRSGKSTLFYQLINNLLEEGVDPKEILLINFEDDLLSGKKLREIFDVYQSQVNLETKPYLFLDEVHRCPDWVLFLRKLYDLRKIKQVFITDSSSKFIKPEYARVLTGRTITFSLFPLSFSEFLKWKGVVFDSLLDREEINKIKKELLEYLKWGGFPEIFFKSETFKKRLLIEYFEDIIAKDIVERYNITYAKIKPLAEWLVSNSADSFSPRKYSRTYGLSLESIDTYIQYFKEVFLFFFIPKFSYSIKTQQLSPKKVYVNDLGFFNNVGFNFSGNLGKLYETVVFLELKRRGKEIYYWRDKHECDFLVKEGLKIKQAIQVSYKLNENKERELEGLMEALEKFGLKEGIFITEDYEAEEKVKDKKIRFLPLWKWLLIKE